MATKFERFQVEKLGQLFEGRPGLFIGPASSMEPGAWPGLARTLAKQFKAKDGDGLWQTIESLLATDQNRLGDIVTTLRAETEKSPKSPFLSALSSVRWRAVLSGTFDAAFDEALRSECQRRPIQEAVSVLVDETNVPPRSIPIYKLLGSVARDSFVMSSATYLRRRPSWRGFLRGFVEELRGAPVFCTGMAECPQVLLDVLSELASMQVGPLTSLLFTADDPLINNQTLVQLLDRTRCLVIPATIGEVCQSLAQASRRKMTVVAQAASSAPTGLALLAAYDDTAVIVNENLKSQIHKTEKKRLVDNLFSPASPSWDPYVHKIDLPRTIGTDLAKSVSALLGHGLTEKAVVLQGRAGSGKTTILKRLAFDLAEKGHLAIWLRQGFFQDSARRVVAFFKDLAKQRQPSGDSILLFFDDPVGLSGFTVRDVVQAAKGAGFRAVVFSGVRSSEWATLERSLMTGGLDVSLERDVPDHFDSTELAALPGFLMSLGICTNEAEAKDKVKGVSKAPVADVLSSLYLLIPETRAAFASSIKGEYFRLGDQSAYSKVVVGLTTATSDLLKRAYELVAVADHYRCPLPIEVLVSALNITYQEWGLTFSDTTPAWGLLYPEVSSDGTTLCYRPRNFLVTRTLIELINGGATGRGGELRLLEELLRSCTGTQPAYREFCLAILGRTRPIEHLTFEEGLRLFEAADASLPIPERTIRHQKALWVKNKGNQPVQALEILDQALRTQPYPYAARVEMEEHIHTSFAATYLDALRNGQMSAEQVRDAALSHLAQARSPGFVNGRAVHVNANLVGELVKRLGKDKLADTFQMLSDALADVDSSLLTLRHQQGQGAEPSEDLKMLEEVRAKLNSTYADDTELSQDAEALWANHRSQQGFVILARRQFQRARRAEKGKTLNEVNTYIESVIDRVKAGGASVAPALYEMGLHLLYSWKIHRRGIEKAGAAPDWGKVLEYAIGANSIGRNSNNAFYRYLQGLALAHLGKWNDAFVQYANIRGLGLPPEILWEHRDWLVTDQNIPRHVQGTIMSGASKRFLYAQELGVEFHVRRNDLWPRDGEITHAYISFQYGGPQATLGLD